MVNILNPDSPHSGNAVTKAIAEGQQDLFYATFKISPSKGRLLTRPNKDESGFELTFRNEDKTKRVLSDDVSYSLFAAAKSYLQSQGARTGSYLSHDRSITVVVKEGSEIKEELARRALAHETFFNIK